MSMAKKRSCAFSSEEYVKPENSAFEPGHPNWTYTTTLEADMTSRRISIEQRTRKYQMEPYDDEVKKGRISFELSRIQVRDLIEFLEPVKKDTERRELKLDANAIRIDGIPVEHQDQGLMVTIDRRNLHFRVIGEESIKNPNIDIPHGDIHRDKETVGETSLDKIESFFTQYEEDISPDDPFISGTILCITALDIERDALSKILEKNPDLTHESDPFGEKIYKNGTDSEFILWSTGSSGNKEIRNDVRDIISEHDPNAVILYGIAAGIDGRVNIEDVIVTDHVVDFRKGKQYEDKPRDIELSTERPKERYQFPSSLRELPERSSRISDDVEIHRDLKIASSDNVVESESVMNQLKNADRKIGGVEMEAAGVIEECNRSETPFFFVKSVCDFGDNNKDDSYQSKAANVAASTVFEGFLIE